jgi:hypothetical protein
MTLRGWFYTGYAIMITAALLAAAWRPFAFQKTSALSPATSFETLAQTPRTAALDVAALIGAIPYQPDTSVNTVLPKEKYRRTIVEGKGSCSQQSFGLAYELDRRGVDFQIIPILRVGDFLSGGGHMVLRTRYRYGDHEHVGVVDLIEGGLPRSAERFLDVADLREGAIPAFSLLSLSAQKDAESSIYGGFLDDTVVTYIPSNEAAEYFRFLEAVYVPLGNERLEKFFYDGLAVVLGFYPTIRAPQYDRLFRDHAAERAVYIAVLWIFRSAIVIVPLIVLFELFRWRQRRTPSGAT